MLLELGGLGMNEYISILLISGLIVISFFAVYVNLNIENDEKEGNPLDIKLTNSTDLDYNITLILSDSNGNDCFNTSFQLANHSKDRLNDTYSITGTYTLEIMLDDGRSLTHGGIQINDDAYILYIFINEEDIVVRREVA